MSMREQRIAHAWLDAPDSGVIELTCDWTDAAMPPLSLGAGGPAFARLTRVPDHLFGCESGFFVNAFHEIFFFLQLAHHPEIDPAKVAVYLAGDFNGWQQAVGNPDWRLLPASLDGERVLLFAAPAGRFFSQPPERFKFVTSEHRWLAVPAQAVNAVRDVMIKGYLPVTAISTSQLFVMMDIRKVKVYINVSERDVPLLDSVRDASVTVDALPGRSFAAKIARVNEALDPSTRTLAVQLA